MYKVLIVTALMVLGMLWSGVHFFLDVVWEGHVFSIIPALGILLAIFYATKFAWFCLRMIAENREAISYLLNTIQNIATLVTELDRKHDPRIRVWLETLALDPKAFKARMGVKNTK